MPFFNLPKKQSQRGEAGYTSWPHDSLNDCSNLLGSRGRLGAKPAQRLPCLVTRTLASVAVIIWGWGGDDPLSDSSSGHRFRAKGAEKNVFS